ncbi:hypothetical protein ACOME3_007099 [Neoechinorhynchus agilis]
MAKGQRSLNSFDDKDREPNDKIEKFIRNIKNQPRDDSSRAVIGDPIKIPYELKEGEVLRCWSWSFEVQEYLQRGTFGKVVRCIEQDSQWSVALKFLNCTSATSILECEEVRISKLLCINRASDYNIVDLVSAFWYRGHICMVFELYSMDLDDYAKLKHPELIELRDLRPIAQQCFVALAKLKEIGIIHTDIKTSNIMLVDPLRQPFRVKLIDFGLAIENQTAKSGTVLQNIVYRAPEVLLGLEYSEAIDMWSMGCTLARLFLGYYIYSGLFEYEQVSCIWNAQGPFPAEMLQRSNMLYNFFKITPKDDGTYLAQLLNPEEYRNRSKENVEDCRVRGFKSLDDLVAIERFYTKSEELDRVVFVDLIKKLLTIDPNLRILPLDALKHPFITMEHLSSCHQYLELCRFGMEVCRDFNDIKASGSSAIRIQPKGSISRRHSI